MRRPIEDASGFRGAASRFAAPASVDELAALVRDAAHEGAPVTIAGALTGVTGGAIPATDSAPDWLISTERLRALRIQGARAVAGAGVSLEAVHEAAARSGQFYAPDPTEWLASVGGSIATNASGSRSFRYGSTRRYVMALTAVMASGEVRRFQRGDAIDFDVPAIPLPRTTKNTAGYALAPGMDWIDLIAGSEGTLAIVAEAELALLAAPGELITGVVFFPDEDGAAAAVDQWRGISNLRMLEFMDAASLDLIRPRFGEAPPASAAILYEQETAGADAAEEIDGWIERIEQTGADPEVAWLAASARDRERFRRFRHALPEAVNDTVRRNGFMKLGSDYAVPIERNREMLAAYRARLDGEFRGRYAIFGHIGDAHVHVNILPGSTEEFERGKLAMVDLARTAVALGGTVSAEHGLGKRKRALLEIQYAPQHVEAMRAVKQRLDPDWRLGRGTLFAPPA
ncbi:MAG: FAD-binding oxidoreductase [Bryobacteraceae bacterium]